MHSRTVLSKLALLLSTFSSNVDAAPTAEKTKLPLPARTVFQLDSKPSWLENIAVRPNGNLLVTQALPSGDLLQLAQPWSSKLESSVAYAFKPEVATALLGITETTPDTYVVLGGRIIPGTLTPENGSFSMWELSFKPGCAPVPRLVTQLSEFIEPNGVAAVPENRQIVLATDSSQGLIFRVDTKTGEKKVILQTSETKPVTAFGANGIKIRDGYAYFANSDRATVFKFKITKAGFPVEGATVDTAAFAEGYGQDDIAIDKAGHIWGAAFFRNAVIAFRPDGTAVPVVGSDGELTVAGPTAMAFGRTKADKHTLYVTTSGANGGPVNGTITEPGKVVAIDTRGFF